MKLELVVGVFAAVAFNLSQPTTALVSPTSAIRRKSAALYAETISLEREETVELEDIAATEGIDDVEQFVPIFEVDTMPGALRPMGYFDPAGFSKRADDTTMKRYREAEVTHGRVAMLAVVGFLVGEQVAGSTSILDGRISGPAISHLSQMPGILITFIITLIAGVEAQRAKNTKKANSNSIGLFGLKPKRPLKDEYYPGDLNFDPLNIRPTEKGEFDLMVTRELQNGRLAMLAVAGFWAQEKINGVPIAEYLNGLDSTVISKAVASFVVVFSIAVGFARDDGRVATQKLSSPPELTNAQSIFFNLNK